MLRGCPRCECVLPLQRFSPGTSHCAMCRAERWATGRAKDGPAPRDPLQVRINNTFAMWFGPVRRTHLIAHIA